MTASIHPARREPQTRQDIDPGDRALADRIVELIAAADADTPETLMDLRTALERARGLS